MDMAREVFGLPRAVELVPAAARGSRWHPGSTAALHSEIFAPATEASGAGAALAFAIDGLRVRARAQENAAAEERAVLWVQDAKALRLGGRPYRPGLPEAFRHRLIHVAAKTPEDALFALEEGVRCRDIACVIGEVAGNPRALDFTSSRRLSLAAEKHGVPLILIRLDAHPDLSSARMRWTICAAPSAPPLWNSAAPGHPAWHAQLFRSRSHAPGEWILRALRDGLSTSGLEPSSRQSGEASSNTACSEEGQKPKAEDMSRRIA